MMADYDDIPEDDIPENDAEADAAQDAADMGEVPPPDLNFPGREDLEDDADVDDDPIAALEAEVAELKDKLLRAMAEAENTRRIASREKENASKYAIAAFSREMLGVADNLDRALDSIPEDARKESETMETLFVGVDMTRREMRAVMERVGIHEIDAMGKPFDPALHEAMFEAPDESAVEGTVVQVLRVGYVLGDRLLRPAQVGIAKGGPKAASSGVGATTPANDGGQEGAGGAYEGGDSAAQGGIKGGHLDEKT